MAGLTDAFNSPGCWSGGYGGPKWGAVAETLRKMVYGEISPEMFSDTGFTLAHNDGPIFNKGMLYHHQNNSVLYKFSTCSGRGRFRSCGTTFRRCVLRGVPGVRDKAQALFPEATAGYVDWYKVCALGAIHGRLTEGKAEQIAKHGASPLATAIDKAEAAKFYVMPENTSRWYERVRRQHDTRNPTRPGSVRQLFGVPQFGVTIRGAAVGRGAWASCSGRSIFTTTRIPGLKNARV